MKRTHGQSNPKTAEYTAWVNMKRRCYDKNRECYPDYGGRGIIVCEEWLQSFEAFFKDLGPRPSNQHSLDRIDVNGNYCTENCRWSTKDIQQNNRRCSIYTQSMTIQDWEKATGLSRQVFYDRLEAGWQIGQAITG